MCGRRTFNAFILSEYYEYINRGMNEILSDFSEVRRDITRYLIITKQKCWKHLVAL